MPARTRLVFLALSAGLFAGCAVGPDYRPPDIALTPDFVGETRIANRQRNGSTDLHAWWVEPLRCRFAMRVSPDRKSTRLNSSHPVISYAVFCLKKKKDR